MNVRDMNAVDKTDIFVVFKNTLEGRKLTPEHHLRIQHTQKKAKLFWASGKEKFCVFFPCLRSCQILQLQRILLCCQAFSRENCVKMALSYRVR